MAAPERSLRRRKAGVAEAGPGSPSAPGRGAEGCSARLRAGTFWLTRIVLLRALASVYFVAFLVALHQNKQLIGDRGLLPCKAYLESVQRHFHGRAGWAAWSYAPTALWLLDWSHMNFNLDLLALLGLGVSSFVLLAGCANMILMAALWALYLSLVSVGQVWYSFGWESQLLETGFLGIFLCPLWTLSRLPEHTPTSQIVLWGFRWLIFRIMLGAGLTKLRGDQCWRDLTCMDSHYETQPLPGPLAYFLHWAPWWAHRLEVLFGHLLELLAPFLLVLGRRPRVLHGVLQILLQVALSLRGNLSFLSWLTAVPSLACFDDASLGFLFPSGPAGLKDRALKLQEAAGAQPRPRRGCLARRAANVLLGVLVAWLSVPVVLNMLGAQQAGSTCFSSLRIVNSYGAFRSIAKERTEVILQGTASANASAPDAVWEDYEFKCKPGDPWRRPCLISPYHYRLDWLMWLAALQTYEHNEWILLLARKLLTSDAEALSLLAFNPFEGRAPPRWIRAEHWRYRFSLPGGKHAAEGKWWVRKRIGPYFPPLCLEDLGGPV